MQQLGDNGVNTPAFLGKLWKMVNDPSTDNLICWSATGNSFIIQNQAQFWYELLPVYYKHNNMSSFVRQLNMYGFHKMSTVENGSMDADKDEIQFTHPCFVKGQPELLRNIKRKVTTSRTTVNENSARHDDLAKVLTDVKQLRGRQSNVDGQLNAMKQENALLWKEVAILRQKHLKQQKIVNKLIQFLVTLVQPGSRMTVGTKRGYQLMLNESPAKKGKLVNKNGNKSHNNISTDGPTIHELDNEFDLPVNNIYEEDPPVPPLVNSPNSASPQQTEVNSPLQSELLVEDIEELPVAGSDWDKPDFVNIDEVPESLNLNDEELDDDENLIDSLQEVDPITATPSASSPPSLSTGQYSTNKENQVFLNPTAQDTILPNLMMSGNNQISDDNRSTAISTLSKLSSVTDLFKNNLLEGSNNRQIELTNHVESTQNELQQFKDILNGYNSVLDTSTLWGELYKRPNIKTESDYLFTDSNYDGREVHLSNNDNLMDSGDPMVSGSELAPYGNTLDFTELFDDSLEGESISSQTEGVASLPCIEASSTVNTPQVIKDELVFPAIAHKSK